MAKISVMALGGLGENGKNLYVVEVNNKIFILDAGMKYPDIDMYGVDGVIPDINYLIQNKQRIEGIFISHGHEDQIGAIPYLLKKLSARVYGTHFTICLVEALLLENKMNIEDFKLFRINPNRVMRFGNIEAKFFNTTHSIPESMGICLETEDGAIVYCTDFNFGVTSNGTYQTTFDKITDIGKHKVLMMLTESVNAGAINRITNDSLLEHNYNSLLNHYHHHIVVGMYSTDLIRIQKIIDLSIAEGRKIAIISKNSKRIISVASNSNYLRIPDESYFNLEAYVKENGIDSLNAINDLVIIVTGYRNEPYQSLVKIALGTDDLLKLYEGDKVLLLCPPIPGTERQSTEAINLLCQYGADISIFDKTILKSSHASPEDLKMLYAMVKPEYIIPIKGEYRHMYEQMLVAKEAGYDRSNILLLDNGEKVTFIDGVVCEETTKINALDVLIDGTSVGIVDNNVVAERTTLAEEGCIFIYGVVDLRRRKIVNNITLLTKGFTYSLSEEELTNSLGGIMENIINNFLIKKTWDKKYVEECLKDELLKFIYRYTKHRPIIIPVITEIL